MPRSSKFVFVIFIFSLMVVDTAIHAQKPTITKDRGTWRKCLENINCPTGLDSAYNLARTEDFEFLLTTYAKSPSTTKDSIVQGIFASDSGRGNPKVEALMKKVAFTQKSNVSLSDTRWYALQFLADECDERALAILNKNGGNSEAPYSFQVACGDWAKSLHSFGTCKYKQSRKVLVDSLNSSCLDVLQSAGNSLKLLFPKSCSSSKTPQEAKACYGQLPDGK